MNNINPLTSSVNEIFVYIVLLVDDGAWPFMYRLSCAPFFLSTEIVANTVAYDAYEINSNRGNILIYVLYFKKISPFACCTCISIIRQ